MKQLIELKQKDLIKIKEKWWNEQNKICPLLKKELELKEFVIDHQHKLVSEISDATGKGCCRGAISRFGNALEGKITNNFKRMGLDKHIDLPSFLRNLADYLEHNHIDDEVLYIHPNEVAKEPKLRKDCYNRLKKVHDGKSKFPSYPSSGKLTVGLLKLFDKYEIEPIFYS